MANGDDRSLVPDPEADALERGRRNLMLRNAAIASRPRYTPGELTAPAMPEAPDLVPAPPAAPAVQPTAPARPPTYQERLQQHYEDVYGKLHPETQPGYEPPTGWRKFGHTLGVIGQDIATAIRPNIMAQIPGTRLNRELDLARTGKELGEEQERTSLGEYRKAQLPKIGAETEKDLAEAAKARGEAVGPRELTGEKGIAINPDTGEQLVGYGYGPGASLGSTYVPPGTIPPATLTPPPAPPQGIPGAMPSIPTAAPQPARPGLPPGFVLGTPKPPTLEKDREKFLTLYNKKDRNDKEEQYVQAHLPEFESIIPVGKEKADQMMGEIRKMPGIDPGLYAIIPGTSLKDANALMTQARQASELNRQYQAPYVAEKIKDRHTYGYAEDPNNVLMLTNKAQADEWGHQFMEVSKADQYKDAVAMGQLNDIVQNTTRYENAVRKLPQAISTIHSQNMATILNDDKIKSGISAGFLGRIEVPGGDFIADILKETDKAHLWNDGLTDAERDVLSAFIRAKSSAIMYQRAAGAITRLPGDLMKLELDNLPQPYVGWKASEPRFRDWQENIDQLTKRFPHNLPGVEHPSALRERLAAPGVTAAPGGAPGAAPPAAPAAGGKKGQWNPVTRRYE